MTMPKPTLTLDQRKFIRHALGLSQQTAKRRIGYRNYFMAGDGDLTVGRSLVALGYALEFAPTGIRPDPTFVILTAGFHAARNPGEIMDREETARMLGYDRIAVERMAEAVS